MTGFAAVTREDDRATVSVTIRALNHRYLDLQLRLPSSLGAIEGDVRALVAKRIARGRVELSLSLQLRLPPTVDVEFNEAFGRALQAALDQARERGLVAGALTPGDLLRLPQALTIRERHAEDETDRAGTGGAGARGRGERPGRPRPHARRARATSCGAISTTGVRRSPTSWSGSRRRRRRAGGAGGAHRGPGARAPRRAAGRRNRRRPGNRPHGGAVRHQRGSGALPRPRVALGERSSTRPSRAGGSSISCCRR